MPSKPQAANALSHGRSLSSATEIVQELHDGLAQLLTFALVELDAALDPAAPSPGAAIQHSRLLIKEALRKTRHTISALQAAEGGEATDLGKALRQLVDDVGRLSRRTIGFESDPMPELPSLVIQIAAQTAKELLINACKHAPRADIRLTLRQQPMNGGFHLTISDNGAGFDASPAQSDVRGGFGLAHLSSRMALIGASLHVHSAMGQGVTAEMHWPCQPPAAACAADVPACSPMEI